uniref:Major facilitator superfamily (MFS) profile domain-containing protein n=1 Tax=Attheya septentrionalis TaxID=420275 RepID=A0A7S2UED8_9STRA|mmetsp:Transcript_20481/g.37104  ORF Transcript_20481/g.37104 Transcript_20481/m.37104 type:complete len:617 (+) Transcript_20481:221-2071(+)
MNDIRSTSELDPEEKNKMTEPSGPIDENVMETCDGGNSYHNQSDGLLCVPLTTATHTLSIDFVLDRAYHEYRPSIISPSSSMVPRMLAWMQDVCKGNEKFWILLLSLGVANSADASELLCLSYLLSNQDFATYMLKDGSAGMVAAAAFFGMLVGGLWVGTFADNIARGDSQTHPFAFLQGRKPSLVMGLGVNAFAGIASAMCPNGRTEVFIFFRVIAGVGIGATVPPLFSLASELPPPHVRGMAITLVASFWMVGSIYVAVVAWVLLDLFHLSWRWLAAVSVVPSLFGIFLILAKVPESPRFLAMAGDYPKAATSVNHIMRSMSSTGRPMTAHDIQTLYPQQSSVLNGSQNGEIVVAPRWTDRWFGRMSQLYTPYLRGTTIPLQIVWFSLCFGTYGLVTWINVLFVAVDLTNVHANALLFAGASLPGNLFSMIYMDRIGRKHLLQGSMMAAATSLIFFAHYSHKVDTTGTFGRTLGIVGSSCAFQAFTIAGWNAIDTLSSELFPTAVRSTGMGVCTATGRIGALLAQLVNDALIDRPAGLLLVASCCLAMGALVPCFLARGGAVGAGDLSHQPLSDNILTIQNTTTILKHSRSDTDEALQQIDTAPQSIRPVSIDN